MVNQLISLAFVSCLIFGQKAWRVFPDDVQEASNRSLSSAAPSSQMPSSTPPEGMALPQVDAGQGKLPKLLTVQAARRRLCINF